MCLNHSETIPPIPGLGKNCLPWNRSLVPKRLGNAGSNLPKFLQEMQLWFTLRLIWSQAHPLHPYALLPPVQETSQCCWIDLKNRDFPGGPVVKNSPSIARGESLIPGQGAKIPHTSRPKKQKQYCNKFNKDLKKKEKIIITTTPLQ